MDRHEPVILKSRGHYAVFVPAGAIIPEIEKVFDITLGLTATVIPVKGLNKVQVYQIISEKVMDER